MTMKFFISHALFLFLLSSCHQSESAGTSGVLDDIEDAQAYLRGEVASLKISLVDAPNDEIDKVFVNIDRVEMVHSRWAEEDTTSFAHDLGAVDLLTLQDGVSLSLADLILPADTEIRQLRFVLKDFDNYIVMKDGSRCDLRTPSQQQSGLKLLVHDVYLAFGVDYHLTVDFDARKSVILTGDGGCLLRPVIKVKSLDAKSSDDMPEMIEVPEESKERPARSEKDHG